MYARKSGFWHQKVKERSKKALAECAKVRKNGLKVGKTRKNHINTPYTLSIYAQSNLTRINTKKPLQ